jgi:ribosomal protein S18 acetylase RimI-like enzyme
MKLRPADVSDIPRLFGIHRAVFRAHIEQLWGWDEAWQRHNFATECAAAITSVVEVDGQTIGYLQILERDSHLNVQNIALSANHQGQGIGSRLLKDLQSQPAARRLPLRLGAFRSNAAALSLYQRLGFRQTGETRTHTEMEWTAEDANMPAPEDGRASSP